jgi:hypothetical protein
VHQPLELPFELSGEFEIRAATGPVYAVRRDLRPLLERAG